MRVKVHPADEGGCGHYRLIWPTRALHAQDHDVKLEYDFTYPCVWQPSAFGDRVIGLMADPEADVVVLQRPLHRNRYELIQALQARGIAVVVEVDDDFHAIHPRNAAWKNTNPLVNRDMNRDWLAKSCAIADLVIVSTPSLARRYGAHERVVVIRNCVPEHYTRIDGGAYTEMFLSRPDLALGWSGSVATHPDDLQATGGTIQSSLDATGATFQVVGTGVKVAEKLGLSVDPGATGWVPIEAYPEALQTFDVGIVPLAPTEFNEAKSALKGLEMAAVGVPFVASPTTEYRWLADQGIGWTADTPDDWRTLTAQLLVDRVHREALSEAWRGEVAEHHTIERNAHLWWEAWEFAYANRTERIAA